MTMRIKLQTLALTGLVLATPALALAQAPGRGAMPRAPMAARGELPPAGATVLLNARRQLELTPRQVAQLDSIERAQWADRERMRTQMRPAQDSMRAQMRERAQRGERPAQDPAAREAMRAEMQRRMDAQRPMMQQMRQRDSVSRAAAQRVLTDAQRQKVREMQAERRGYARGMREARGAGGMRGAQGARGMGGAPGAGGMHDARGARGMGPARGQAPAAPRRPRE
jgi:hypothetical protein